MIILFFSGQLLVRRFHTHRPFGAVLKQAHQVGDGERTMGGGGARIGWQKAQGGAAQ